ncbi:magnesium-dependent phosphatase-1 [Sunxiuqinia sp. A32]|uniref:magnesium-dependent phosphatase-1 n=1 Tax=Sunxiuqinia sp. A32 TaxID=3461496 RepID=UPI0040461AA9
MEIFVFDLDFTLWNAGDTFCSETNPPYQWHNNKLLDQEGRLIRLYPETIDVLEKLSSQNKIIAAASRTHQPSWANKLLELFDIDRYFAHKEIYRGSKIAHLQNIKESFNVPFNKIVFFDDEERNIQDVSKSGVECIHVKAGIKQAHVNQILNKN